MGTTSEPACELEGNAMTCVSQGGSFECNSCTNDITGELCCSCQNGEESSTTPSSTLATTTTSTSAGLCKSWCANKPVSWEKKCKWKKCAGCSPCSTRQVKGSGTLFQWWNHPGVIMPNIVLCITCSHQPSMSNTQSS